MPLCHAMAAQPPVFCFLIYSTQPSIECTESSLAFQKTFEILGQSISHEQKAVGISSFFSGVPLLMILCSRIPEPSLFEGLDFGGA